MPTQNRWLRTAGEPELAPRALRLPLLVGLLAGVCGGALVVVLALRATAPAPSESGNPSRCAFAAAAIPVGTSPPRQEEAERMRRSVRQGGGSRIRVDGAAGPARRIGSAEVGPRVEPGGSAGFGTAEAAGAADPRPDPTRPDAGESGPANGGPAAIAARPGADGELPDAPPTDPDLLVLWQLGVDLTRPEEEMERLAAEYRAALIAAMMNSGGTDPARQALLDRGMAALLRVKPQTSVTVFGLLDRENERVASRYFAQLLRGGPRADLESALGAMATIDPNPERRASAVLALGPAPSQAGWPPVLFALRDPSPEVRRVAAGVIASAADLEPVALTREEVRDPIRTALTRETDGATRTALLRAFVGPSGAVSAADRAFLAALPLADADPFFRAEWARAVGPGN